MIGAISGYLIGWRREEIGGAMTIGGIILFFLIEYAQSVSFPEGMGFIYLSIPGVLFVVAWSIVFIPSFFEKQFHSKEIKPS